MPTRSAASAHKPRYNWKFVVAVLAAVLIAGVFIGYAFAAIKKKAAPTQIRVYAYDTTSGTSTKLGGVDVSMHAIGSSPDRCSNTNLTTSSASGTALFTNCSVAHGKSKRETYIVVSATKAGYTEAHKTGNKIGVSGRFTVKAGQTTSPIKVYLVKCPGSCGGVTPPPPIVTPPPPIVTPPPPSDTTPPSITITAPAGGATVSGPTVTIAATASDNVGVVGVQFQVDGGNLGAEDTTAPYSINWDATTLSNGGHTVKATARDAAGNSTYYAITVNVSNAAPPGTSKFVCSGGVGVLEGGRLLASTCEPWTINNGPGA